MLTRIVGTLWLGLLIAGCSTSGQQTSMAALPGSSICAYYGVPVGSAEFTRCVSYQDAHPAGPSVPPYRMDQYNNRVDSQGYRVDSLGRRMAIQNQY